jgi:tetratricopeptide (TPR) repeat protein
MAQQPKPSTTSPPAPPRSGWVTAGVSLLLLVVTLAAYQGVRHNDFIPFDDLEYVVHNPPVRAGLSWETVNWAFTSTHVGNWHPLTWLSHALDCQVFGLDVAKHHMTNLGFHAANSVLLLLALQALTGSLWRSAFVAACFALHPLHVESVAWVAERKDLLSGFFFMLTLLAYAAYARRRLNNLRGGWLPGLVALLSFGCGLLSKPMLVTVPFLLLLLDYWPLERLHLARTPAATKQNLSLVLEKVPFFALAVITCVVTLYSQAEAGAFRTGDAIPSELRLGNALLAMYGYLLKTVWPSGLAIFYPFPSELPLGSLALASVILLGLCLLAIVWGPRQPYTFTGWYWFLGMLVPVLGIVQVGEQAMADRYTYLPLIGIFVAATWFASHLVCAWRHGSAGLAILGVLLLAVWCGLTHRQVALWRNGETLFTHALRVTSDNYLAHCVAGDALAGQGRSEEALKHYDQALVIFPNYVEALVAKGRLLHGTGRLPEALDCYQQALKLAPDYIEGSYNYGAALQELGRPEESIPHLQKASKAPARATPPATAALALSLARLGRTTEAESMLDRLPATDQQIPHCLLVRAIVNTIQGIPEVGASLVRSAQPFPASTTPLLRELAELLGRKGRHDLEAAVYSASLEANPKDILSLNNLAWLLATSPDSRLRDGPRAARLATLACELDGNQTAFLLGTRAAAEAEAGDFTRAVETARIAQQRARAVGADEIAAVNAALEALYLTGQPYRNTNTVSPLAAPATPRKADKPD